MSPTIAPRLRGSGATGRLADGDVGFLSTLTRRLGTDDRPAGDVLVEAGRVPGGALVVRRGAVRLEVRSGSVGLYAGSVTGPALVGAGWALSGREAPFDVVSSSRATIVSVPTAHLLAAIRASPVAALGCALAIDEMSALCERAITIAAAPLVARIAHVLLEGCPLEHTGVWNVPRTHREIAAAVGTARQCVSRVLKDLERAGTVRRRYGEIAVIDVPALQAMLPW